MWFLRVNRFLHVGHPESLSKILLSFHFVGSSEPPSSSPTLVLKHPEVRSVTVTMSPSVKSNNPLRDKLDDDLLDLSLSQMNEVTEDVVRDIVSRPIEKIMIYHSQSRSRSK